MRQTESERIQSAAELLRSAESEVRVLRTLDWDPAVKHRFFARGARELPVVEYPPFDASNVHARLDEARKLFGSSTPVDAWLQRIASAIAQAAELLAATGTPQFLEHSTHLYGQPSTAHGQATPLELARTFDRVCAELSGIDLGAPPPACHLAEAVAARLRAAGRELFGDSAPAVVVVDQLSANALAGARRVQVRRDACFTDRDVEQLVQHEMYVHVCTALNGRLQAQLPILGAAHAATTRTQEGLAVFAELITGTTDLDRLRRLGDRVLAIQMSIEGADFLDIYRYFLGRVASEDQAFQNARRVFRGGQLDGGAPFTKDCVYLGGLLSVTSFLRSIVSEGRLEDLQRLFCGKLDIEDIPALAELADLGLCSGPTYLPPWASDRRFLVAHLTYSSFLSRVQLG